MCSLYFISPDSQYGHCSCSLTRCRRGGVGLGSSRSREAVAQPLPADHRLEEAEHAVVAPHDGDRLSPQLVFQRFTFRPLSVVNPFSSNGTSLVHAVIDRPTADRLRQIASHQLEVPSRVFPTLSSEYRILLVLVLSILLSAHEVVFEAGSRFASHALMLEFITACDSTGGSRSGFRHVVMSQYVCAHKSASRHSQTECLFRELFH